MVQFNKNNNADPTATSTTTAITNVIWYITKYKYKNKYPVGRNSHNVSSIQKYLKGTI